MGNQTSQQSNQRGAGYTNNFNDLQNKIESLVVNSKKSNFTETINFSNSSDLDLDSLRDQDGGNLDHVSIKPRRARYLRLVQTGKVPEQHNLVGGTDKTMELSSIDENDFQILRDILKQHQTGGNLLHTDAQNINLSPTSAQPVDFNGTFSPTSHSDQIGGCGCTGEPQKPPTIYSPTSHSEQAGGACTIPTHQSGGCGCNDMPSEPNIVRKPTYFKALIGGKKSDKDEESEDEEIEESEDDINSDDEGEDEETEDDEEDEEEDNEDEDYDENSDGDELARSKDSSSSKSDRKKKHHKQKRHNSEYVETTDDDELSGGSTEEHTLTKKYIYSDHDTFYGSDDNSEYYKHIKNRSMIN
jgi:hypothetical protein